MWTDPVIDVDMRIGMHGDAAASRSSKNASMSFGSEKVAETYPRSPWARDQTLYRVLCRCISGPCSTVASLQLNKAPCQRRHGPTSGQQLCT